MNQEVMNIFNPQANQQAFDQIPFQSPAQKRFFLGHMVRLRSRRRLTIGPLSRSATAFFVPVFSAR